MVVALLRTSQTSSLSFKRHFHRILTQHKLSVHHTTNILFSTVNNEASKESMGKYSHTVFLPKTKFEQRANAVKREPEIQSFWNEKSIYENIFQNATGKLFTLHDGPPYANGDLHMGHALNKILKDFINRYQILQGKKVQFVPGWDCHGLPIELKVIQTLKKEERERITPVELRQKATNFAKSTVQTQMKSFQRYGVWGDYQHPYLTLAPTYEAEQIKVFGEMFSKGYIYRGQKPVHWSPSSRTALAEAELEYPDNHISKSIYVAFPITKKSSVLQFLETNETMNKPMYLAIWTTTPWTLPGNTGIAVNGNIEYALFSHPSVLQGNVFVLAKDLVETFVKIVNIDESITPVTIHSTIFGRDLTGTMYSHPLYARESPVVEGGEYITTESGTGLVHTAPGHGQEDYQTGLKYNLPMISPVDDAGRFTSEAGDAFVGLNVLDEGNTAIIKAVNAHGLLLKEYPYHHKYPYDWRTKKPTIFRSTKQWFASVSQFREQALKAIDEVKWIPYAGRNRIANMTQTRGDWCISRQRAWGVPIPVFYHKVTEEPLLTNETLAYIYEIFRTEGSDAWWILDTKDLLPPGELREQADQYIKGKDTMDVWFDSGTSWAGVLKTRASELAFPADLYLEGSDQSRGWFQSSLLTSVATQGQAPYKAVLTHGFLLDEKGNKMSKSLGNTLDPSTVIDGGKNLKTQPAYGADVLRMWVSYVDYTNDVSVGPNIIKQVSENYRKVRNTVRFLLGSLDDFDPQKHLIDYEKLPSFDKYMLGLLTQTMNEINQQYQEYQFYKVHHHLLHFASIDLSVYYLDICKDRLYISSQEELRRRSAQTVLYYMLTQYTQALAPILPHLAEDIWQHLPYKPSHQSVFEAGWIDRQFPPYEMNTWNILRQVRNEVNQPLEHARRAKLIGASLESQVFIHSTNSNIQHILKQYEPDSIISLHPTKTNNIDDLRFNFMVSQVTICDTAEEVLAHCPEYHMIEKEGISSTTTGVKIANGKKCQRCWYYCTSVGHHKQYDDLCQRCATILSSPSSSE